MTSEATLMSREFQLQRWSFRASMDSSTAEALQTVRAVYWLLLLALQVNITHSASLSNILAIACSSLCQHGACRYHVLVGVQATLRCECQPGWGGEQCSQPCGRRCLHGRCVSLASRQACLCYRGFRGEDCSLPGYDLAALLSMATVISPASVNAAAVKDARRRTSRAGHDKSSTTSAAVWLPENGAGEVSRHVRVPAVQNPREQVERNVELGSHQCIGNFVCRNGGRCVKGEMGGFRCQCLPPFTGTFCQNACPKPCLNGGSCVKLRERPSSGIANPAMSTQGRTYVFKCSCPLNFAGEQCQRKVETEMEPGIQ